MSGRMQNLTGETIITTDGKKHRLGRLAGYGAQGVVYEDESGSKMIKLYYPTGSGIVDEDVDRLGAPGGGEGADGVEGGCVEREDADALRAAFAAGFDDLCCGLFGFGGATASEVDGRVAFCQREGKRVADS